MVTLEGVECGRKALKVVPVTVKLVNAFAMALETMDDGEHTSQPQYHITKWVVISCDVLNTKKAKKLHFFGQVGNVDFDPEEKEFIYMVRCYKRHRDPARDPSELVFKKLEKDEPYYSSDIEVQLESRPEVLDRGLVQF